MKKITSIEKIYSAYPDYFLKLNQAEEMKENSETNYETADFLDENDDAFFTDINPIGIKATLKLYLNPKNPSENPSLIPLLAQHYIDVTEFTSKFTEEVQNKDKTPNVLIKVLLLKNNESITEKCKPTVKNFFNFFFFKRTVFKRKNRKVKKNNKLFIKRKAILTTYELTKGVFSLNPIALPDVWKNKIKTTLFSLKSLRVVLVL